MDIIELMDDLRTSATELSKFGGTHESRQIGVLAEKMYYLALEVKRIHDQMQGLMMLTR